jgi:hypothetical protein
MYDFYLEDIRLLKPCINLKGRIGVFLVKDQEIIFTSFKIDEGFDKYLIDKQ